MNHKENWAKIKCIYFQFNIKWYRTIFLQVLKLMKMPIWRDKTELCNTTKQILIKKNQL